MARAHGANSILIEKAGIGQPLIQALKQDSATDVPNPIGIKPEGEKAVRMEAQTAIPAPDAWQAPSTVSRQRQGC